MAVIIEKTDRSQIGVRLVLTMYKVYFLIKEFKYISYTEVNDSWEMVFFKYHDGIWGWYMGYDTRQVIKQSPPHFGTWETRCWQIITSCGGWYYKPEGSTTGDDLSRCSVRNKQLHRAARFSGEHLLFWSGCTPSRRHLEKTKICGQFLSKF